MNDVKQLAFTVFCCSIACCIAEQITPETGKKQMHCIIGMILMISVFSPIKELCNVDLNFYDYYTDRQNISAVNTDNLLEQQFKTRLSEIIQNKLSISGIFADEIRIEINMSGQQVDIESITVIFFEYDEQKLKETKYLLSDYLNLDVNVMYIGGENLIER